ncbi:MAG: response regulator, partial [Deltaproteobacteria bacterium]|nr:response regulator [Deltaproteobacteria bacterium]
IIMITSHGQEQMVIEAIEAGAKGYVLKPVNKDKLKEHIEQVFDKYGAESLS